MLKSFLPPKERRGIVLVDPPFEQRGDFDRLARGLKEAHRRWATGVYMLWYPIKDRAEAAAFAEAVRALALPRTLLAELAVATVQPGAKLSACGLVLVNPPWRLDAELKAMLPWLARTLALDGGGGHRLEWLAGEAAAGQTALPVTALPRSEEHTSELQSLMRISYVVYFLSHKTTY